jgi:predicted NUDIX family phosphoesterase
LPDFEFVGLLNDDTVDVGVHHLGVVYLPMRPAARWVRETHKLSGSFEEIDVVRAVYDRMETWSQLALDAIVGRRSRSGQVCTRRDRRKILE